MIYGWSIKNTGFKHSLSKKCPANLSNNLAVVLGGLQSTLNLTVNYYKNSLALNINTFIKIKLNNLLY